MYVFAVYIGNFTVCLLVTVNIINRGKFTIWFSAAFTIKQWW